MPKKNAYHHGDLRNALLEAALAIVEAAGVEALSLRGVARKVGVSAPAMYAHFSNKDALLAEAAAIGFSRLAGTMENTAAGTTGVERVHQLGVGYVHFALENEGLFRLMFAADHGYLMSRPNLAAKGRASYALIETAVAAVESEPGAATTAAWALVHGLAVLMIDKRIAQPAAVRPFVLSIVGNLF